MKSRIDKMAGPKLSILFAAMVFIMLSGSCNLKIKSDAEHKKLIPEKEFISILTDYYMANGLLSINEIRGQFSLRDSLSNYTDIVESHGYTYDAMNSTINHYYLKKPKKLVSIYDQIIAVLSEMELRIAQEAMEDILPVRNLWPEKPVYEFPDTSGISKTDFSITIDPSSGYSLEFSVVIYPFDQTINPCFIAWYCNADSSETGIRTYLPVIKFIRDGFPHTYKITDKNKFTFPVILNGSILNFENNPGPAGIHARISDISFNYSGMVL